MSRPPSRANSRPPSRAASVSSSARVSTRGNGNTGHVSQQSHVSGQPSVSHDLNVTLKDCESLIRLGVLGLPGGVTKTGCPLIFFPNTYRFNEVLESDLHLLLKYYVSIIPRTEQVTGFALVIDRNTETWPVIQQVFNKVTSVFPATIKEVFLVYKYPSGGAMLGQLVDSDYLLDFDIFHVSAVTELLHYVDGKYLGGDLGAVGTGHVDTWIQTQHHVDRFTATATQTARKLSAFMRLLHQDTGINEDMIKCAERNRNYYHQLRQELEAVQGQGGRLVEAMGRHSEAAEVRRVSTSLQILAVRRLCAQLDTTWQYFTNTFKMQDQLYVQNIELAKFCSQFKDLANKFAENEKIIRNLPVAGSNLYEVSELLDKFDNVVDALSEDVEAAVALSKVGSDLILEHEFARDSLEPKCTQLRIMVKTQEILFLERRQTQLKFVDLFEGLSALSAWCSTASHHLNMDLDQDRQTDVLSQIRQIDYLLSKARGMKIKSRVDFEEDFDDIKHLITAKTLFSVGDKIKQFEEVKREVANRRAELRSKAATDNRYHHQLNCDDNNGGSAADSASSRRGKVLEELLSTEENYVEDLHSVLYGYRDRLDEAGEEAKQRSEDIFGNMEEIFEFHSQCLLPDLERCGEDVRRVGKTFLEYSEDIRKIYGSYCGGMDRARLAVESLAAEQENLLTSCQVQLGHQLPLSSYLLKPVQRLTKYQLLLKDLVANTPNGSTKYTLELSLDSILVVIKAVNDSLHTPNIKSLPEVLQPLGSLICQETFTVTTENKSQSQLLFRKNAQRRHILLYENHLILCKYIQQDKGEDVYMFKLSLPVTNMGMSSMIKGEERRMEVWIIGQPDAFTLEAKTKKAKDDFASELRKVIAKEKGNTKERLTRIVRNVVSTEALSANSGSDTVSRLGKSAFSRARSLDGESWSRTYQDTGGSGSGQSSGYGGSGSIGGGYMDRSSSVEQLEAASGPRYRALADYTALTARELNLHAGEVVELVKVGCAGWWFTRLHSYPYTEGWAPSTYLEKLSHSSRNNKNRNRTLDRF